MNSRSISAKQINDTVKNGVKIKYNDKGVRKTGYYSSSSRIFVSTRGKMTYTVINKVDRKYVNSLVRGDRMKITYDPGADALYIAFIDNDKSDRVNGEWPFNVDITSDNKALGIEILEASSMFKQEFLDQYK